jgi:uncharacterized protein (TIGR03437 family)
MNAWGVKNRAKPDEDMCRMPALFRFTSRFTSVSLAFLLTALAQQIPIDRRDFATATQGSAIATADFNGDGKPDLAILNTASLDIYLGKGDGTFLAPKTMPLDQTYRFIRVGDFNKDGKADVVLAGGIITVLLGAGDGSFSTQLSQSAPDRRFDSFAVGDFNGDGKLDVVGSNCDCLTTSFYVMYGNGNGTLAAPKLILTLSGFENMEGAADLNGDGRTDLYTANRALILQSDGSFVSYPFPGAGIEFLVSGDVNGDGKPDLVASGFGNSDSIPGFALLNHGDGTFSVSGSFDAALIGQPVALLEFNGDGKADYLSFGPQQTGLYIALGNGDGTFQRPFSYALPFGYRFGSQSPLVGADFDGDGRIDVAVLGGLGVNVLLNRNPASANRPIVNGALNGAGFVLGAPLPIGGIASLFGSNFASANAAAAAIPLPLSLAGASATVNNIPAPLFFVSPGQINLQIPWNALPPAAASGAGSVVVTTAAGASQAFFVLLAAAAPALFTTQSGIGQAIAINPDGSLAAPEGSIPGAATHPAQSGEALVLLGVGLGPVDAAIQNGAASGDELRLNVAFPVVLIGGMPAQVLFSGLSPQFVGVNQLNVMIPAGVTIGNRVPFQVQLGTVVTSSKVTIAIQ